jgi:hypothetical protein
LGVAGPAANPAQVALDVRHEDGNADPGEPLGHHLQRDGLAGAGRAGDEAVTIRERREQASSASRVLAIGSGSGMTLSGVFGSVSVAARGSSDLRRDEAAARS